MLFAAVQALKLVKTFGEIQQEILENTESQFAALPAPAFQYHEQPRDHWNKKDKNTWLQKYYVNDDYYKPGGPVIFELNGEWTMSASRSPRKLEVDLAKRYNGLHIGIQHRYYGAEGDSQPVTEFTNENLKWLTEAQALADFAAFAKNYTITKNLPKGTKWIATGGSYAGNLAAWIRFTYPDIIWGAHSSSGPVLAKMDYWEYSDAVDLGFEHSGGNPQCHKGWLNAVSAFDYYATKNASWVKEQFGAYQDIEIADVAGVTTVWAGMIQYGEASDDTVSINGVDVPYHTLACNSTLFPALNNGTASKRAAFDDLVSFTKLYSSEPDFWSNYDTKVAVKQPRSDNILWTWQFCKHYGYFQVANRFSRHGSMYSKLIDNGYYLWYCKQMLADKHYLLPNTLEINFKYHAQDIVNERNNIVFVNGELDPWARLGVTPKTFRWNKNNNQVITVAKGHHCSDLTVPKVGGANYDNAFKAYTQIVATWDKLLGFNQTLAQ
ncbi:peptidase S28 [Gorgonomyces haynaldii]|nr:peptidase S28 [Gorgonomyces haynaldii]